LVTVGWEVRLTDVDNRDNLSAPVGGAVGRMRFVSTAPTG
jgi:hypothetical protein